MARRTDPNVDAPNNMLAWSLPILLMLMSLCSMTWLTLAPQQGRPMLAVFPPWWSRTQTLQALVVANGSLVELGNWSDMLVAAGSNPELAHRLRKAGAWFLLDARNATGCVTMFQRNG